MEAAWRPEPGVRLEKRASPVGATEGQRDLSPAAGKLAPRQALPVDFRGFRLMIDYGPPVLENPVYPRWPAPAAQLR